MISNKKVAVIVFPGTNCDVDTYRALEYIGFSPKYIWHDDIHKNSLILNEFALVVLPGGFSYGDYIRAGMMASFSPIMDAVRAYVQAKKGFVLGICNGFQILCESGLLPGALHQNIGLKFICDVVELYMDGDDSLITLPIAHKDGCYYADKATLKDLQTVKYKLLKYKNNPNGSKLDIAGIYDVENKVFGLMPHPERAVFDFAPSKDGITFLQSLL